MAMLRQIQARDVQRIARFNYVWVALGVLVLYYSLALDPFFSGENWIVIIRGVSVTGLYALGNSLVFLGGGVDVAGSVVQDDDRGGCRHERRSTVTASPWSTARR